MYLYKCKSLTLEDFSLSHKTREKRHIKAEEENKGRGNRYNCLKYKTQVDIWNDEGRIIQEETWFV